MSKTASDIVIQAIDGGRFSAYLSKAASPSAPGLVLMQYICGVNRVMRAIADDFASRGYHAIVPDLFWRQQPNVRLIDDPARPTNEEQQKALALNAAFDDDYGAADLVATIRWLRSSSGCSGKVGTLGYCLGGRLAYLMAARSDADCNIGYYGVNIEKYLGESARIGYPLMLHVAGRDELSTNVTRAQIRQSLENQPLVSIYTYDEVGHAFALPGGRNFNAEAAELANRRSSQFLARHLNHSQSIPVGSDR